MIIAENITKSYGDLQVLKGIDLKIDKGEIISIVGPSGAGKTTFLQILGTLSKPDSGKILFENSEVNKYKDKQLAAFRNKNIGFVFQFHHLLPEFTALENVCIPAFIAQVKKEEAENKAKEIMGFLNLSHRLEHKPKEMSGGEQQRVAVARALINGPAVIFADEPSGNLDSQNKKELHDLFFSIRKKYNSSFVIVTHDEGLANMADRKLMMKDGKFI
ncbi:MAG: lipoprotein ABC transporter ATP-binding protein [Bacteroidetes bacterium GWF2_33_16]|nr:MAG: lipoprotein ABC transporter ATP-binding protein [Bacteroidetes bacterium GWE2_32_14]OFY05546.1 MAG: lipoprotein ABC transporter ATP-binding protein [Bacteroidetes bacterium GWF2_33_16]